MEKNYGLQKLLPDPRDFSLGKVVAYPALSELPDNFEHEIFKVKDQRTSDFCAAFASTSASELQEGVELSPEFLFAMSKQISGNVNAWGQDLRSIAKAHAKIGCIEKIQAPYSLDTQTVEFLRDPKNWPTDLDNEALVHAKGSFMDCKGPYDAFDNLRATIWLYRNEKKVPFFGVEWGWSTGEFYIKKPNGGFGHAILAIGWRTIGGEIYLTIQNSYGNVGDNGKFYLSREVINSFVPTYGAIIMDDMTPAEYQERLKALSQNWILVALKKILEALGFIAAQKYIQPKPEPVIPIDDVLPEPAPPRVSRIPAFAEAIKTFEGWFPGSKSFTNHNPGNIKNPDGTFMKFATDEDGMAYLCNYLTRACTGQHKAYKPDFTLKQFFSVYAPAEDNNSPDRYASFVANRLNVSVLTEIKHFL